MDEKEKTEIIVDEKEKHEEISENTIRNLIYVVRGQQVMLDSDLAMLYQVETKRLNENVKRNRKRFPYNFCFQLTEEEMNSLRSQFATSKEIDSKGGRRYTPYVFTEQGIAMLSAVLRSDVAIQVSIKIMNAFVAMRRFLVIDESLAYHIGASLKDAGKKCFAINKIEDKIIVGDILHRLSQKEGGE